MAGLASTILEFAASNPLAEILADSLPVGEYRFVATLTTNYDTARVPLGRVELPASMYPLPDGEAPRDGFYYRAGVESAPVSHALARSLSRDCPLRLLAFEAAESRETVPLPEPAWAWPESCGTAVDMVRLGPGESTRFELDVPTDELRASSGASGRYYLVAIVRVDHRPIRMKAGELELPGPD